MKTLAALSIAAISAALAHADFSYTQTRTMTGGMLASMAGRGGPQSSKVMLKGQKMRTDDGKSSIILDLDGQTITNINHAQKTYTVRNLADLKTPVEDLNAKADVKETGQTKTINGFHAKELVVNMEMESPQIGKAQMEMDMWISSDVPGAQDLRAFYSKNADKVPWQAMAGGGNPSLASGLSEMQKKMASLNGVPLQQIVRIKAPGAMAGTGAMAGRGMPAGPTPAQMSQMSAGMEKARKQLEAMAAQGGPAAAIAKQQLDKMGPAPGAAPSGAPAASDWLIEMTIDSSNFSSASIPETDFAVPAGYTKN
jgi:hypothetical protein